MAELIPFEQKLRQILCERNITILQFSLDTGIDRWGLFYKKQQHKHHRSKLMAIAYYLKMTVEELVDGTDAMEDWYG